VKDNRELNFSEGISLTRNFVKNKQEKSPVKKPISFKSTPTLENLPSCLAKPITEIKMLNATFSTTSTPPKLDVEKTVFSSTEELLLPAMTETELDSSFSTPIPEGVENTQSTGRNLYRDFNRESNIPDRNDKEEKILEEGLLTNNDFRFSHVEEFDFTIEEPMIIDNNWSLTEKVWGFDTFDEELINCAPPSLVEGCKEENIGEISTPDAVHDSQFEVVVEGSSHDIVDIKDMDLLKWIIDDQQINDIPLIEHQEALVETYTVPVTSIHEPLETLSFDLNNFSDTPKMSKWQEDLKEDEKYRKMRNQNNEASRKCRQKRKLKQQEMEEECEVLQQRNEFLKLRVQEMEREVKIWKKKLLTDIKNGSTICI